MSMNDDELIRDAVHELVAAAPPPKPLPMGGASGGGPYRWLAIAAAAVLVVGGIVAIAWSQADDDNSSPVATTQPAPPPTPPVSVATSAPATTSPVTVTAPPTTVPATVESSTTTTSTSTTTTTSTTTVAPTPEQAQVEDYLTALAEGRYDDAARVLNEGGLEPERRADMRPLYTEYGDINDLAARLQSWCEDVADCSLPDAPLVDIGGFWATSWSTPGGPVVGYFRSGSFEGSPSVHGLPPRRPAEGPVTVCPTNDVEAVREADLDVDGQPETVVLTHAPGAEVDAVWACNTSLSIPLLQIAHSDGRVLGVLGPDDSTLLFGISGDAGVCGAPYRLAASAGALVQVGPNGCWGPGTGTSIGCRDVNGESMIVQYRYTLVGGDLIENSTGMNVDVLSLDGAPLDSFSLTLPDQSGEALQIVEPYCNGLPVMTEG